MTEPIREGGLVELAASQGEDERDDFFLGCVDAKAVHAKEEIHGLKCDTLVAVHEGMVAGESEAMGSSECSEIRLRIVAESVSWAFEG